MWISLLTVAQKVLRSSPWIPWVPAAQAMQETPRKGQDVPERRSNQAVSSDRVHGLQGWYDAHLEGDEQTWI